MAGSTLEYLLLGLLGQGPSSGYDLRKQLTLTPMRHHSDSPGAVYPALRRLLRRRWIDAAPAGGARRRQELRLNDRGRAALALWLKRPVTREDVVRHGAELLLRFALMGGTLQPPALVRFLRQYQQETLAYLEVLRRYHTATAALMPLSGRLAFEHGLAQYQVCRDWARRALVVVGGGAQGHEEAPSSPDSTRKRGKQR